MGEIIITSIVAILSAGIGGLIAGYFTIKGVTHQFEQQKEERKEQIHNQIISSIDVHLYNVKKLINLELTEGKVYHNKEESNEIFLEVKNLYKDIDSQIQEIISLTRLKNGDSNELLRDLLISFKPVENQFHKLTGAQQAYNSNFEKTSYNRLSFAHSKIKLNSCLKRYMTNLNEFSLEKLNHQVFQYDDISK